MTREKAIEEIKNYENYPNGLSKECRDYIIKALEQEPFINKPCVSEKTCEHDKQKVLDKIRTQIKSDLRGVEIALEVLGENDPLRPKMEGAKDTLENCLEIIDKAESEKQR